MNRTEAAGSAAERRIAASAEQAYRTELSRGGRRTPQQMYTEVLRQNPQAYQDYKLAKRQKAFRIQAGLE